MIKFEAIIQRYDQQGEKTGWTYIPVPAELAAKIKPGNKKSFRVKGKIDEIEINSIALIPIGGGDFILPLNAGIRKVLKKRKGEKILVMIKEDRQEYQINPVLLECLQDDPAALEFFHSLLPSHQRYFSKWIEAAKTASTRDIRIARTVNALVKKWSYSEMIRAGATTTKA